MPLNDRETNDEMLDDWAEIQARHAADAQDEPAATPPALRQRPAAAADDEQIAPAADETTETRNARSEAAKARTRTDEGRFDEEKEKRERAARKGAPASDTSQSGDRAGTQQAAAADPAAKPAQDGDQQPAAAARTVDVNRPPSSWTPAAKAAWQTLPEPIRQEIHRREGDFFKGTAQLRPDAELGAQFRQVAAPFGAIIQGEGGNPVKAFNDYLNTAAALRMADQAGKIRAVMTIVQRFGVDPRSLVQTLIPQGAPPGNTPGQGEASPGQHAAFRDPRVDDLLQQMQTREQRQAQEEQQRLADERGQIEQLVDQWMQAVDEKGAPLRPYIDNVFPAMNVLVPQIRQANPAMSHIDVMAQAYEQACWADPAVRKVLQQEAARLDAERNAAANRGRVRDARRASSVNVPRRASTVAPAKPASLDETIADTARELGLIT